MQSSWHSLLAITRNARLCPTVDLPRGPAEHLETADEHPRTTHNNCLAVHVKHFNFPGEQLRFPAYFPGIRRVGAAD